MPKRRIPRDQAHDVLRKKLRGEGPPSLFSQGKIMTSVKHSGQYTAVIDRKDKTIKVRSRISSWNVAYEIEADLESLDQAIDMMQLEDMIEDGYKLIRE